jgi:HlyD family secretion protein
MPAVAEESNAAARRHFGRSSLIDARFDIVCNRHKSLRYRLTPGMQVAAEIHLGNRSVLEYLLSPIQKTLYESGRER